LKELMTGVFSRAFPGHTLEWSRHPEHLPPPPDPAAAPPPPPDLPAPPLHGFLEHQAIGVADDDSVGHEQSLFSADTQLKSPVRLLNLKVHQENPTVKITLSLCRLHRCPLRMWMRAVQWIMPCVGHQRLHLSPIPSPMRRYMLSFRH
jgi:hypothetical protein